MILTPRSSVSSGMMSPISPYPGFDQHGKFRDPVPASRLKFEGVDFAEKNKGSIGKWVLKHEGGILIESARPVPRCPTSQSMDNYNRDKHGSVKYLMNGEATPRQESVPSRILFEGVEIAVKCRKDHVKKIFQEVGKISTTSRLNSVPSRIKYDGVEIAIKGRKDHIKTIFEESVPKRRSFNAGKHVNSFVSLAPKDLSRQIPRCPTSESVDNYERDRCSAIKSVINGNVSPRQISVPCKVKWEGIDIAAKSRLDHMKKIFNEDGNSKRNQIVHTGKRVKSVPDSDQYMNGIISNPGVPRVPTVMFNQGRAVESLMHTGEVILDPKPIPRVTTADAARNFNKDKIGKVKRVMRETGRKTCVHIPGLQDKSLYYQAKLI